MTTEINTLEDFERACKAHDLTYSYSDDGYYYRKGADEYANIEKAAAKVPRAEVERIWNAMVDTKLVESARAQFYWRWPQPPYPSCRKPEKCAGKGYCSNDIACNA